MGATRASGLKLLIARQTVIGHSAFYELIKGIVTLMQFPCSSPNNGVSTASLSLLHFLREIAIYGRNKFPTVVDKSKISLERSGLIEVVPVAFT